MGFCNFECIANIYIDTKDMHISKIDRLPIVYRIIANEKTGVEVMYYIPHLID